MKLPRPHFVIIIVIISSLIPISPHSQPLSNDTTTMLSLKNSLNPPPQLGWSDADPCKWRHVFCNPTTHRVTRIQIPHQNLQGTLPLNLTHLTHLQHLDLQYNNITGPLPTLTGLTSLQLLLLNNNRFTLIPHDFFSNLYSLQSINIDDNPFSAWVIPESLRNCTLLTDFSANSANITGRIPDFFSPIVFSAMKSLHLAFNSLEGDLPMSLAGLGVGSFWVNGQMGKGRLGGGIGVLRNMTSLREVWLHKNAFTGELPDFSGLRKLESLSVRDNLLTGVVPLSLLRLQSLRVMNLTNNLLQGGVPVFNVSVSVDMSVGSNSFCLPKPGECDGRVNVLLSVAKAMGYPVKFAENWKGNDPCDDWFGITCNDGNVSIVNFEKMGLNGSISPDFSALKSLQRLVLAGNNLTGTIPVELTTLPELTLLDVSKNQLRGKVPAFKSNLILKTNGNVDIEKDISVFASPGKNSSGTSGLVSESNVSVGNGVKKKSKSSIGIIVLLIMGGVLVICLIGLVVFCFYESKKKRFSQVQSPNPRHSGSDADSVKVTVAGSSVGVGAVSEAHTVPTSEASDIQMVEAGNMVISIQVLKNVTNNFSTDNILGKGGFGTVYKGELHDGTKIAVKRMEGGVIAGKGLAEFKSEIAVLTKVRHRHLVALLGYCLDGNEKLLVYEYMPQGTLSRHLFNWPKEGLKPLEWTRRLTVALDVARGVEYLHGLAHQSFIHRDLKPSNILLGDDMRAKVSDFGLVRLAPEGKGSIQTRIAGTFGYLAPEYAVTGRVTTKADVFSFGVILMELITGRKALDESQPEESMHLVTWFQRMHLNRDTFQKAIDPSLDLNEETLASISTAAELAGHCCAREPYQRPDMGHAVNVLSSLVEIWRPSQQVSDDIYGIDLDMSLPQALKKWQAFEGRSHMDSPSSSSFVANLDNTSTSIPNRPIGFAESFMSVDGR